MKEWACIYAVAVLTVSALTRCSASVGAVTMAAQTEATTTNATEAEMEKKEATKTAEASERVQGTTSEEIAAAAGKHHIRINVKDYDTIPVELYGDEALITMANFLRLVKDGFYDGLTFHRIISGFMIRGGGPLDTDTGDSDQGIRGEFSNNGVENPLSHTRGAISTARPQIKGSTSSQFFIVHEDSTFLDGDYACFGYVTGGMGIVDAICEDIKVEGSNGSMVKDNQPVIESIEVVD